MRFVSCIGIICIVTLLSGCLSFDSPGKPVAEKAAEKMAELKAQKTRDHYDDANRIDVTEEKYLGGGFKVTRSKALNLPEFFSRKIAVVKTSGLNFYDAIEEASRYIPCDIEITPFQDQTKIFDKIVLKYQGSVKGLLDRITSGYNLYWEFEDNRVSIFRTKTESYKIYANIGKVDSTIEMNNSSSSSSGSTVGVSGSTSEGKGIQRSRIISKVELWQDIDNDIKDMISEKGKVTVNRVAGLVSVTDTPWVHRAVKEYVDALNTELSRQVAITVKVYNLDIDDESNHGFNADAVFTNLGEDYRLSLKTISDTATSAVSNGLFSGAVLDTATGSLGKFKGSEFVLEALKSHGKVSLVTTASGVSLNNQDMPIQNVKNTGYPAEASTSSTNYNTTNALIPGNLTTGFSMIVTPHILDNNKIILQYSVSLSNLDKMNEFKSGSSTIQTPDYSSRSFTQRVALESGSTLLLAGFETESNTDKSTYKLWGLENEGASQRSMIVVMITVNNIDGAKA